MAIRLTVLCERCSATDPDRVCRGRFLATEAGTFRFDYEKQAYTSDEIIRQTKLSVRWKVGDFTGDRVLLEGCPWCHIALASPADAEPLEAFRKTPPPLFPRSEGLNPPMNQGDGEE
jgi:hypothetical protein